MKIILAAEVHRLVAEGNFQARMSNICTFSWSYIIIISIFLRSVSGETFIHVTLYSLYTSCCHGHLLLFSDIRPDGLLKIIVRLNCLEMSCYLQPFHEFASFLCVD